MSRYAHLGAAAPAGDDKHARMSRLQDLIARAAGASASGIPVANHGEAQGIGAQTLGDFPGGVLLTFIDAGSQSHVVAINAAWAAHLREQLGEVTRPIAPPTCKRAAAGAREPIARPSGGI